MYKHVSQIAESVQVYQFPVISVSRNDRAPVTQKGLVSSKVIDHGVLTPYPVLFSITRDGIYMTYGTSAFFYPYSRYQSIEHYAFSDEIQTYPQNHSFIYLFLAVLGLRFCERAVSSCGKRGPLFIAVRGPLTVAASLVAEHRLQTRRLSSCGSRA